MGARVTSKGLYARTVATETVVTSKGLYLRAISKRNRVTSVGLYVRADTNHVRVTSTGVYLRALYLPPEPPVTEQPNWRVQILIDEGV